MREEHIGAVGQQLIAWDLLNSEDKVAAREVFAGLGPSLLVLAIRKDP